MIQDKFKVLLSQFFSLGDAAVETHQGASSHPKALQSPQEEQQYKLAVGGLWKPLQGLDVQEPEAPEVCAMDGVWWPYSQDFIRPPVGNLIIIATEASHCGVPHKLHDAVVLMSGICCW